MPNDDNDRITLDKESGWIGKYPPMMFLGGGVTLDYGEQLDRIETKLDRLLAILDKDKGLWVAPGPDEPFGHFERED